MKPSFGILGSLVLAFGALSASGATVIGLDRLIGTIEPGTPADPANEVQMINFLVTAYNTGAYANGARHDLGDNPADPQSEVNFLNVASSTLVPSFGSLGVVTLADHTAAGGSGTYTIDTAGFTYEYLTAKYGNRTAVFHVAGVYGELTLPVLSAGNDYFAGVGKGKGYGLSGTDFFLRGTPTPEFLPPSRQVPDGGSTLGILGLSLLGVGGLRRLLSKGS